MKVDRKGSVVLKDVIKNKKVVISIIGTCFLSIRLKKRKKLLKTILKVIIRRNFFNAVVIVE